MRPLRVRYAPASNALIILNQDLDRFEAKQSWARVGWGRVSRTRSREPVVLDLSYERGGVAAAGVVLSFERGGVAAAGVVGVVSA